MQTDAVGISGAMPQAVERLQSTVSSPGLKVGENDDRFSRQLEALGSKPEEKVVEHSPAEQQQMKELEALFISMMLKNLRQTESGEGLFPGDKSDTFGGMFDMYLGDHLAEGRGVGLSEILLASPGSSPKNEQQTFDLSGLHAMAVQAYSLPGTK